MTAFRFTSTAALAQGPRNHQDDRLHAGDRHLVICDGMGGHHHGGRAAGIAIHTVVETNVFDADDYADAIRAAGDAVRAIGHGSHNDPGTTLVGVILTQGGLVIGWAGDSRAYLVREDTATALTHDHAGVFGLKRCLGAGLETNPDLDVIEDVRAGDRVVLISDGVVASLGEQTANTIAAALDATDLLRSCESAGLHDNTTIVIGDVVPWE